MDGKRRADIRPGQQVEIVLKKDQPTGRRTRGVVRRILTNSPTHPHGIKVMLEDGQVGRVQAVLDAPAPQWKNPSLLAGVFEWSGLRGSNSPPSAWEADALPDELNPRSIYYFNRFAAFCQCIAGKK